MNRQVIVGSWKNIATDTVLTFYTDGRFRLVNGTIQYNGSYKVYLQPIITQYFIDNKSEIWLLFLIAHSKR